MWFYQSKEFTEEDIGDYYGFVYCITNNTNGRKYIGRKYLTKAAYKTVRGKRKKIRKPSDWSSYYGSNVELQEDVKRLGAENFTRTILHLCKTRSECNYYEIYEIITNKVLLKSEYYNSWASCKIHKSHLKTLYES